MRGLDFFYYFRDDVWQFVYRSDLIGLGVVGAGEDRDDVDWCAASVAWIDAAGGRAPPVALRGWRTTPRLQMSTSLGRDDPQSPGDLRPILTDQIDDDPQVAETG